MLTGKQRALLRARANAIDTVLTVGKEGVGDAVIASADQAITTRELIKGRVLPTSPVNARAAGETLSEALAAELVQVVGGRFVLYRRNPEKPETFFL